MGSAVGKSDPHWLEPPRWWKRVRPLRWLLALGLLLWIASALDLGRFLGLKRAALPAFLQGEPHPETSTYTRIAVGVPLVDRFRSYEDLASVQATLSKAGYAEAAVSTRRAADSSRYPPYRLDTVVVNGYRHLDNSGRLSLQLFNDRLFQADFVPEAPEAYARRLGVLGMARERNARREKIDGDLRMASTVDLAISPVGRQLGTEPFVLWQDLRLIRERDQWDADYGALPKQILGE